MFYHYPFYEFVIISINSFYTVYFDKRYLNSRYHTYYPFIFVWTKNYLIFNILFWNNIILWIFFLTQKYDEEFKARGLFPHLICYLIIFLNHPLKVFFIERIFLVTIFFCEEKSPLRKMSSFCVHIRFWLVIELEHSAINYLTFSFQTQPFNWHISPNSNCHNFFRDIKHIS